MNTNHKGVSFASRALVERISTKQFAQIMGKTGVINFIIARRSCSVCEEEEEVAALLKMACTHEWTNE
jgi:hypothetical protein